MLKLFKYLIPQKRIVVSTVILVLFNNVLALLLPFLMAEIINNGITKGDLSYIAKIGSVMLAVSALNMGIAIAVSYFSSNISASFSKLLRREVFLKIESFSQAEVDKIGVPSLITRSTNDIRHVQDMTLTLLKSIVTVPVMLIGGSVMAVIMDPKLSLIIIAIAPIIAVIAFFVAKKIIPMFKKVQAKTDKLNLIIRENINGIRVTRAFNRKKYETERFNKANFELTGLSLKISRTFAALIPILTLFIFSIIIALVLIGGRQIQALTDTIEISNTIGDLQAFILYLLFVILALSTGAAMFIMIPRARISALRISEVLEMESQIKETNEGKDNSEIKGRLEFKNVSFGYNGDDGFVTVLDNISFTAKKGEVTAIIGGTGSGKSTVINLIPRFYDALDGQVIVDGVDVRDMRLSTLRSKIGFIPQQVFLFSGTIADNLRYGKEDATDEELWRALEISQAKDFVQKLPDGINHFVSQSGINLSGGQKQRLAIARAIIKNAEFYIFDDSFSALDYATDSRLRQRLHDELIDANIIIVAQRVGTIINADRIIVLDNGKIAAIGKHEKLIETSEIYREIVESQLKREEMEAETNE
ncbi:MAG: ABC transporter ATP-binding protein [Clostridiales bacterium]|nr:ABC transporter ATP-binding protein [Clostridiales bacterium]